MIQPSKHDANLETIESDKGTFVEAIFGVVFLEFGYEEFTRLIPHLNLDRDEQKPQSRKLDLSGCASISP